jgi:hypothetical protein
MKAKNTSSAPKVLVKEARKQGRRDGKNQVPRQEWGANSVPYLGQLHKKFASFGRELDLSVEQNKLNRENAKVDAIKSEIQQKGISEALARNLDRAEAELAKTQSQLDGAVDEVPMAKFARMRLITNSAYVPFLILLFIGEFTITAPAFRVLLGESRGTSLLVTLAVSGLSVGAAHILGIYLKSLFDRSRPKNGIYNAIFITGAVFLTVTIVYLSYIRAANSALYAGMITEIPQAWRLEFLWSFYTVLQLTFIAFGTAISFMHYSEIETALRRAKIKVWFLRRLQTNRDKKKIASGTSVEGTQVDTSKVLDQELEVLESKKILLRAQYEEVCAIYRDANIHARRDEMDGAHIALRPLELDFRSTGIDFHTSELVGTK